MFADLRRSGVRPGSLDSVVFEVWLDCVPPELSERIGRAFWCWADVPSARPGWRQFWIACFDPHEIGRSSYRFGPEFDERPLAVFGGRDVVMRAAADWEASRRRNRRFASMWTSQALVAQLCAVAARRPGTPRCRPVIRRSDASGGWRR